MALSISNIVNVQLNTVPKSAGRRDFGTVALFTPETGNAFSGGERYIYVESQKEVELLFGSNSETAKASLPFFAQSPRAKNLLICRWQKAKATIPATANALRGGVLNHSLAEFKQVVNGAFSLVIGSEKRQISGLNLSETADFNAIATAISEKLNGSNVVCTFDEAGERFILETAQAGLNADSVIFYAEPSDTEGEYIGAMLKLEDGQAVQVKGQDRITLPAESIAEALAKTDDVNNGWYGFMVADGLNDDQILACAKYAQENNKLFGMTATRETSLEWSNDNVFKILADGGFDHTLAMFDKNDSYAVSSAMARLLSMNFAANNSTITLKFKTQPTITADEISATEMNKAKRLGINVYTYFDDVAMIAEGTVIGGKFADEIVILDWFKDAVQKEVFARLYKSPTKLPLTDRGQAVLLSAVEKVCLEGINNGAFASGIWTGDGFGTLETGDLLEHGYYVYAAPMDTLSDSDREQRKATPIQVAVKLAGAIHSTDVMINFNR